MLSLQAKIRNKFSRQTKALREGGVLPAVLYGEGIKENIMLEVDEKEFEEVFKEAGESSLVSLEVDKKKYEVLVHQIAKDPLTGKFIHIDFFHPSTKKKVEAEISLVFEGEAEAVRDFGGIFVRELQTVQVRGLAHKLPREIKVDIGVLKTFEDKIFVKDLIVPEGIEILRGPNEIVAHVTPPKKVEEEEEKPKEEEKTEEKPTEGEEGKEEEKKND